MDSTDLLYAIDRFSVFQGTICVAGWVHHPASRITALKLSLPSQMHEFTDINMPSPDVAHDHGSALQACRFHQIFPLGADAASAMTAELVVELADGRTLRIRDPGNPGTDPVFRMHQQFVDLLQQMDDGPETAPPGSDMSKHLLEIGSRARSGITRRTLVPAGWRYTGFDVMPGPNVDVVGDAHCLSQLFPAGTFNAVMSFAVFEHLLMPWKVIIELNKVLRYGAVGIIFAPQCWPIHEVPCDYWRYSDQAWHALLNRQTGFEIIDAKMGEPAFNVAQKLHPVTDFGDAPGYLNTTVIFRKTAETRLEWPVVPADITSVSYPNSGGPVTADRAH